MQQPGVACPRERHKRNRTVCVKVKMRMQNAGAQVNRNVVVEIKGVHAQERTAERQAGKK